MIDVGPALRDWLRYTHQEWGEAVEFGVTETVFPLLHPPPFAIILDGGADDTPLTTQRFETELLVRIAIYADEQTVQWTLTGKTGTEGLWGMVKDLKVALHTNTLQGKVDIVQVAGEEEPTAVTITVPGEDEAQPTILSYLMKTVNFRVTKKTTIL